MFWKVLAGLNLMRIHLVLEVCLTVAKRLSLNESFLHSALVEF